MGKKAINYELEDEAINKLNKTEIKEGNIVTL